MSQINLKERLGSPPMREPLITDCVHLVDAQVRSKSGLSGVAIKGAYATIKKIKQGFVSEVIDRLLDEWLDKVQPYYDTWAAGREGPFAEFVIARSEDVAEDLLSVTDARAEKTSYRTAQKVYKKMRGSAKNNVVEAVPELARLIERRLGEVEAGE